MRENIKMTNSYPMIRVSLLLVLVLGIQACEKSNDSTEIKTVESQSNVSESSSAGISDYRKNQELEMPNPDGVPIKLHREQNNDQYTDRVSLGEKRAVAIGQGEGTNISEYVDVQVKNSEKNETCSSDAREAYSEGHYAVALSDYEECLKNGMNSPLEIASFRYSIILLFQNWALTLLESHDFFEAKIHIQEMLDYWEKYKDQLAQLFDYTKSKNHPISRENLHLPRCYMLLALCYYGTGDYDNAIETAKLALQQNFNDDPLAQQGVWAVLGSSYSKKGNIAKAQEFLNLLQAQGVNSFGNVFDQMFGKNSSIN